jgi:NitT/TauT family transport system permease protein
VFAGLSLGVLFGAGLAVFSHSFSFVRAILNPVISVIKAMPVATFIIILWITLRGSLLSVFIGFMMVLPIIYQNLLDGYDSIDKSLVEVTEIFEFSSIKRFKLLIFPALFSYFCPLS